jgi:hypothetical protein
VVTAIADDGRGALLPTCGTNATKRSSGTALIDRGVAMYLSDPGVRAAELDVDVDPGG